jgi:hypothetical protein
MDKPGFLSGMGMLPVLLAVGVVLMATALLAL